MNISDLKQLIEDECEDNEAIKFVVVINEEVINLKIEEDTDFVHDENGVARLRLVVDRGEA